MATRARHLIQDQNISIHFDGAALLGKNDTSKAQKKGGLGGRKALHDISNSAKPSALQAAKRNNSTNSIAIGKDLDATGIKFSVGTKDKGGRKALADVTNSSKSSAQQVSKKGLEKKPSAAAAANIPTSIAEEQCLDVHQIVKEMCQHDHETEFPSFGSPVCLSPRPFFHLFEFPNYQSVDELAPL